jgi:PTH1 family peptidyl-tRNA hydrolase
VLLSNWLKRIFSTKSSSEANETTPKEEQAMKFLIVGLGNIGAEYEATRHNIGFTILDAFAKASNVVFTSQRYGAVVEVRLKNQRLLLLKPSTYMNLSGEAVRYWMQKEKIELDHVLVVVDDLALPFGTLRLRGKGADGGHNGLKNINQLVGSQNYARLRFGIRSDFPQGAQIDYVLGPLTTQEQELLPERVDKAVEAIKAFCLSGLSFAMTHYNNK